MEVTKSKRTLRWLTVDLLQSKISETRCQLTADGEVQEIETEATRFHAIQWGKLGEVQVPKLDWPDYPVRRVSTGDLADMMRLMSLATQLGSFDDPAVTAQTGRSSSKR